MCASKFGSTIIDDVPVNCAWAVVWDAVLATLPSIINPYLAAFCKPLSASPSVTLTPDPFVR